MSKRRFWTLILVTLSLGISFAWSIGLDREWGTDYGGYYVGTSFLSSDYRLYHEHFDHKGPVYYASLHLVGDVIGFGPLQAVISLFLTTLLFVGSVFAMACLVTKSTIRRALIVLVGGATLAFQPTNASISLFQTALLIWSFYFLYQNLRTQQVKYVYASLVFFLLASLTRVDAFLFGPMYFFARFESGRNVRNYAKIFVGGSLLLVGLFMLFSLTFRFDLAQYFNHNFLFNRIHGASRGSKLLYIWYRPETFKLFLVSGLPIVLALTFSHVQKDKSHAFVLFISLIGFLAFILTNSDKNYYIFILYAPLLFSVTAFIDKLKLGNICQLAILAAWLIYSNAVLGLNLIGFSVDVRDGVFLTLKSENDRERVAEMKQLGTGYGIFERSWIYLFADVKPKMSLVPAIYNNRYAANEDFFDHTGLADLHKTLLKKKGTQFLINKGYFEQPNTWLRQLLDASCVVKDNRTYQIRKIERFDYGSS